MYRTKQGQLEQLLFSSSWFGIYSSKNKVCLVSFLLGLQPKKLLAVLLIKQMAQGGSEMVICEAEDRSIIGNHHCLSCGCYHIGYALYCWGCSVCACVEERRGSGSVQQLIKPYTLNTNTFVSTLSVVVTGKCSSKFAAFHVDDLGSNPLHERYYLQ